MENNFWTQKWEKNEIGFHLPDTNPMLVKYIQILNLKPKSNAKNNTKTTKNSISRIFLPLCGKTLDIAWLLAEGYRVAGAELSSIAVDDLFKNLNLTPLIETLGEITHYSAANIDIFVGDIFKLTPDILGKVDAIYDRAALVALPDATRKLYTAHLLTLTNQAPQLLICFEYNQTLCAGPPFSIDEQEVKQHYQNSYRLNLLASEPLAGGIKGQCPAIAHAWWLQP